MDEIKTVVRIKPGPTVFYNINDNFLSLKSGDNIMQFEFSEIFDTDSSQVSVFCSLGKYVLENISQGYNACIMAYGQTNSGKTYTMLGTPQNPGLVPRICEKLFDYTIDVSYLELYNEELYDLIGTKTNLQIVQDSVFGIYVKNLEKVRLNNYEHLLDILDKGNAKRQTGATESNLRSSRSHAIIILHILQKIDGKDRICKLYLVDLAGCERLDPRSTAMRQQETKKINLSLLSLNRLILNLQETKLLKRTNSSSSIGSNKDIRVMRDSRLTHLLSECIGGNARTCIIANISLESAKDQENAFNTVNIIMSASKITNRARINTTIDDTLSKMKENKLRDSKEAEQRQSLITELEQLYGNAIKENKDLHDKMAKLEKDKSLIANELKTKGDIVAAIKENSDSYIEMSRLKDEFVSLQLKYSADQVKIKDLERDNTVLRKKLKDINSQSLVMQGKQSSTQTQKIYALEAEIEKLTYEKKELQKKLLDYESAVEDLI